MTVLAIDPGPAESAFVVWDGSSVLLKDEWENCDLVRALSRNDFVGVDAVAIEQIRGFGVLASDKLFDTCHWTGRFLQAFGEQYAYMIPRKEAAAHVCGTGGISKDQFVREALIARFGGKETAIGNKRNPGPLYGISGHLWAALAVAITWHDKHAALLPPKGIPA